MSPTHEQLTALALQWKAAATALRNQRHRDIRHQNNADAIDQLNELVNEAIKKPTNRRAAGFVELYKILSRQAHR